MTCSRPSWLVADLPDVDRDAVRTDEGEGAVDEAHGRGCGQVQRGILVRPVEQQPVDQVAADTKATRQDVRRYSTLHIQTLHAENLVSCAAKS